MGPTQPVPFTRLFRYASRDDIVLICIANVFILYSSLNIPLVNIVYGLMMREMNDYVARRAQFSGTQTDQAASSPSSSNHTQTTTTSIPPLNFNGTLDDAKHIFMDNSYSLCTLVIVFGITRFVALYLALWFFSMAAANQARRVKRLFFASLLRQEVAWFESNRTGDFALRITSDLSKFEDGIGEKIALCLNALFAWISSLVSAFYYGWELTLVCLVLVPLTVITTTCIAEFQASYSVREGTALSRAFSVCHEVISSIRTVFSFSGQRKEISRFSSCLQDAYLWAIRRNAFAALNLGFTWMSGYLGFSICLLYSTKFYSPDYEGKYDEAQIITILWSAAGCVFLLNRMMPFIELIQIARGSAANLFAVIERKSLIDVESPHGVIPAGELEATVRFESVTFTYPNASSELEVQASSPKTPLKAPAHPRRASDESASGSTNSSLASSNSSPNVAAANVANDDSQSQSQSQSQSRSHTQSQSQSHSGVSRPTIRDMTLEVKAGQTVALVGPSGSGKSTALALLQRFYELDSGTIWLGGHELSSMNLAWLRGQFGVVTQEPVLFDMSVADNIRLGAKPGQAVSDYDVEQAARSANAHAFIARLPEAYETRVGARGVQLSGGQKQRISIARALIRQPKILLLDEATSALDLESEAVVQKALDQARVGRTTFVVAHRLATIRNADLIVVFDKGTIVESGTHEQLLHKRGLYHAIHSQQRQGIDLVPSVRRNSQLGASLMACADHLATRESRSLSIYGSTTAAKYATSGAAFGAAGHGGNGEGVDGHAHDAMDDYMAIEDDDGEGSSDTVGVVSNDGAVLTKGSAGQQQQQQQVLGGNGTDAPTDADMMDAHKRPLLGAPKGATGATARENHIFNFISSTLLSASGWGVQGTKRGASGVSGSSRSLSVASVLRFVRPDWRWSLVGILASLLMGLCIPISAMIIGNIASQFSTDDRDKIARGLHSHGLMYAGLALFAFCISFVQVLSFGFAGEKMAQRLRLRGFDAILRQPLAWFDHKRNSPGSICARLATDVGNIQSITGNRTAVIFQSISILVSTFVFAVYFNIKFSAICAFFVAILLTSTVMQSRFAGKLAVANRGSDAQIGKIVLEASANIKTLVSLHQESYFISQCEMLLAKDTRSTSLDNHLRLSLESLKYAMTAISKGSSFYVAARMLLNDEISIDVVFKLIEIILYGLTEASKSLIFISDLEKARRGTQNLYKLIHSAPQTGQDYLQDSDDTFGTEATPTKKGNCTDGSSARCRMLPRFLLLGGAQNSRQTASPASKSFENKCYQLAQGGATAAKMHHQVEVGVAEPDMSQLHQQHQQCLDRCAGRVRFEDVRFNYPSRPEANVLRSLSFEIEPGQSVALVGRSGCGKSTVVQLLQKFYTNYAQGSITLDGQELRALPTEWVRRQIGLVSQEPSLLSMSIADNIRYGDNSRHVDMDEVVRAAQTANIHDFIMSLPDGYETKLSEANSLQLSGGQKQRIAIARALVRRAPILVFDEATSALDASSERQVQQALDRAQKGRTSIIIAHRLSAVKAADRIVVLRDGQLVEQGSHAELMERRGEYYCLYRTQSR